MGKRVDKGLAVLLGHDELMNQYQSYQSLYLSLCREVKTQIEELLKGQGIKLGFSIESRVKEWISIEQKIKRYEMEIDDIRKINDIAGLRIVVLFKSDLVKVCDILEQNFEVIKKEDTQNRLAEDQFGYGSIHFEVSLKHEWTKIPTLSKLEGLVAEIQVRTGSQHIWAASSHLLNYKKEADVPPPLRRTINRVAALLETVDLEFERVSSERESYKATQGSIDNNLNVETLQILLDRIFPQNNKEDSELYSRLIKDCIELGITNVEALREILIDNHDKTMEKEQLRVNEFVGRSLEGEDLPPFIKSRIDKGVFYTHVGLTRESLRGRFGEDIVDQAIANSMETNE